MLKKEARKLFREKRNGITDTQKIKWDDLLLIQFQQLPLPFLSIVLSFYPIEDKKEVNTFLLTDYLLFKYPDLQLAYPKTDLSSSTMQAYRCHEETVFEKNQYHIYEPQYCEIISPQLLDMVLVPMLAFDRQGNRIGYGKGYYDSFLKQCRPDCIKVGVCYFEPIAPIADATDFDVPLNFCITPQQVYVF